MGSLVNKNKLQEVRGLPEVGSYGNEEFIGEL